MSISVENLYFKYELGNNHVLENVSLQINENDRVGIIGESGCGKSTLLDLILRLLEPSFGQVVYSKSYNVGYVPQSIYLLDDTIAANIAFGNPIRLEKIKDAFEKAQLSKFIAGNPAGAFEFMVGERGNRLSGGERQRIGIARALYNNPDLLVMDEATNALDSKIERELLESVMPTIIGGRTVIMITHKIKNLWWCNKIVEVKNSNIVVTTR